MVSAETEALIALSAALATRDPEIIREALRRGAAHADGRAVEEVLLQAHLFVGFPDSLNALAQWREVSSRTAPAGAAEDQLCWSERGEMICARVYGGNYGKLRRNVAALHPDLDEWMVTGGYGRVIGRAELDLETRELCLVALLAVWRVPRQLHSHLRGALNAGASPADVERAVEIGCEYLSAPDSAEVRVLWGAVRERVEV